MIEGRYARIMGETPEHDNGWRAVQRIATHFLSFDAWLFTVPMWNFGVPYRLKHYVDLVTQPGMTFRNDSAGNVEGLGAGRTAIVVAASAMDIRAGSPLVHLDFQLRYLEAWLGFIGVTDIRTVQVSPTFGAPDAVEAAMVEGCEAADAVVESLRPKSGTPACRPD